MTSAKAKAKAKQEAAKEWNFPTRRFDCPEDIFGKDK